jgi:hypothetical protein
MTDPIQPQFHATMNQLAGELDRRFNPPPRQRTVGFALFSFEFGKTEGGRVNYISNGNREDMIVAVKEWLARAEGRHQEGGRA